MELRIISFSAWATASGASTRFNRVAKRDRQAGPLGYCSCRVSSVTTIGSLTRSS
jgi:hypothetical protein